MTDNFSPKVNTEVSTLICAYLYFKKLHPSEGYVWFLLGWLDQDWWDTDKHNDQPYTTTEHVPCSSSDMKTLVDQGYFTLSVSFYGEDEDVIQGGGTVKQWKNEYNKKAFAKVNCTIFFLMSLILVG